MSNKSKVFDEALRKTILKSLIIDGFVFDGSRTFRRVINNKVEIINFQLGQRTMEGKFTVNLGVYEKGDSLDFPELTLQKAKEYDCKIDRRERIGMLMPNSFSFLDALPIIGFLFNSKDYWWSFSIDSEYTESQLKLALASLKLYGFTWLEQKSSICS